MKTMECMGVKIGYSTMRQKKLIIGLRNDIYNVYGTIIGNLEPLYYNKIFTIMNHMISKNMLDIEGYNEICESLINCVKYYSDNYVLDVSRGVLVDVMTDRDVEFLKRLNYE